MPDNDAHTHKDAACECSEKLATVLAPCSENLATIPAPATRELEVRGLTRFECQFFQYERVHVRCADVHISDLDRGIHVGVLLGLAQLIRRGAGHAQSRGARSGCIRTATALRQLRFFFLLFLLFLSPSRRRRAWHEERSVGEAEGALHGFAAQNLVLCDRQPQPSQSHAMSVSDSHATYRLVSIRHCAARVAPLSV
jgi:hypothetical protein